MRQGNGSKPLAALFQKYTNLLLAPQASVVATAVEVIDDVCGIKIPPEQLTYTPQSRLLSLRVSGPIKSEVMLHKTEILAHIKGRLGSRSAPNNII